MPTAAVDEHQRFLALTVRELQAKNTVLAREVAEWRRIATLRARRIVKLEYRLNAPEPPQK